MPSNRATTMWRIQFGRKWSRPLGLAMSGPAHLTERIDRFVQVLPPRGQRVATIIQSVDHPPTSRLRRRSMSRLVAIPADPCPSRCWRSWCPGVHWISALMPLCHLSPMALGELWRRIDTLEQSESGRTIACPPTNAER